MGKAQTKRFISFMSCQALGMFKNSLDASLAEAPGSRQSASQRVSQPCEAETHVWLVWLAWLAGSLSRAQPDLKSCNVSPSSASIFLKYIFKRASAAAEVKGES